ncbi:MAG: type III-B CRISPR module RAMP protein Cmr6 [Pseudomonadota bacterium]
MMRPACPAYLGANFSEAAPGHRFGLYYTGWNDDFTATKTEKTRAVESACALPEHSRRLLDALLRRQQALAEAREELISFPCRATSPFATGLGNEHPLENGFSFLTPYGLPYLPGSSVKGVLRRAAEELASGEWGDAEGWNETTIRALFGPGEEDPTRDDDPRQGSLVFWDVFPQPAKHALAVEIMTPHLGRYYQGETTPNTSLTPNPIPFLAVPSESTFTFHIACRPERLADQALRQNWRLLITAAFRHAAEWLGFGAKTAVGYGRMRIDEKAQQALSEARDQRIARAAEAARRKTMSENQRHIAEFIAKCQKRAEELNGGKDKPNTNLHNNARELVKAAKESADWTQEEKQMLADAIEEWLPRLIERLDAKETRKQLKLAELRGAG